jgi:hypothetical protein
MGGICAGSDALGKAEGFVPLDSLLIAGHHRPNVGGNREDCSDTHEPDRHPEENESTQAGNRCSSTPLNFEGERVAADVDKVSVGQGRAGT